MLITLCSFRYSHMGTAGYPRNTTPFLDSLAAKGTFFENAVSASSWTKPSVASILTGLTPNVHRLTDVYPRPKILDGTGIPNRILADGIVTLAECLRTAGYATGARINNVHAGPFFNLTQGFDESKTEFGMTTGAMLDDFAGWLGTLDARRPFFFFLMTRDAHIPYAPRYEYYVRFNRSGKVVPRDEYRRYPYAFLEQIRSLVKAHQKVSREMQTEWIDLYDAGLAELDGELRRIPAILAEAGRDSDTIIVVTADHGEWLFDAHFSISHSGFPAEALIQIPLIFCGPDIPAGRRPEPVVRSIDLYPTLASLARAEAPAVVQGVDLLPLILGESPDFPRLTAFSSYEAKKGLLHAVRDGRYKLHLLADGARRLFDLHDDPQELQNVIDAAPAVAGQLEEELARWLDQEEILRELVAQGKTRQLTPEVLEELRALGYIE